MVLTFFISVEFKKLAMATDCLLTMVKVLIELLTYR